MNNNDITYDELLNACMTQNEFHKLMNEAEIDVGELQSEIKILRKLHLYASCKRRIAEIQKLQGEIHENITSMIDNLEA